MHRFLRLSLGCGVVAAFAAFSCPAAAQAGGDPPLSALLDSAALAAAVRALPAPPFPAVVQPLWAVQYDSTGAVADVSPVYDHLAPAASMAPVTAAVRVSLLPRRPLRRAGVVYLRVDAGERAAVRLVQPAVTPPMLVNRDALVRRMEAVMRRHQDRIPEGSEQAVRVRYRVSHLGVVDPASVTVARSSNDAALDSEAVAAVAISLFQPGTVDRIQTAAWVTQPVRFRMESTSAADEPPPGFITPAPPPPASVSPRASAPARTGSLRPWLGMELLTSAIDGATASTEGVGGRGWGAQLNVGVTALQVLTGRVDLGLMALNDKRRFTEETTAGERTSGVAGGLATVALGLRTPSLPLGEGMPASVSAGAGAGHSWISANRSIDRCLDCTAEDVHVDGGTFWEAGVQVDGRGRSGVSLRYRAYGGGSDLRSTLLLGWMRRL